MELLAKKDSVVRMQKIAVMGAGWGSFAMGPCSNMTCQEDEASRD